MSRLKELLLLGLRMALFAFLAMALAQPFVKPKGAGTLADSGPRVVVLVLDDSASMSYREGDSPLFQRARDAAATVLRNLGSGDRVALVLAGDQASGPEVAVEPTSQIDEVQRALDKLQPGHLSTDLSGAIARAEELAGSNRAPGQSTAIYVFSDLQESGWDSPVSEAARGNNYDTAYFFVSIRPKGEPVNRAVTAIRYGATRPHVGVPFPLRPMLALAGDDGKDFNVQLHVDGEKVSEQKAEHLPGGRWATARFYHAFQTSGWHSGYVEIDKDNLESDNRRYFALEVPETTQTLPVLAVNGAPSHIPSQDELWFLKWALEAAPEGQRGPFQVTPVAPTELAGTDLTPYPLVVLANVDAEKLTERGVEKLEEYVDNGGKLIVFVGDKVNTASYNTLLAGQHRRNEGLLPGRFRDPKPVPGGRFSVSSINYEHRALAPFQEPKLEALLGPAIIFRLLPIEAPASNVLMKTSKGLPLLCEKSYGKGKVLLFASTCDGHWSNFPKEHAFPLWVRFVADYLTQTPLSLRASSNTGEAVRVTPPSAGSQGALYVRKPNGDKVAVPRSNDGSGTFEFTETAMPGVYTVLASDQETRLGMFAVNLESHESDLRYLDASADEPPAQRRVRVEDDLKATLGQPPLLTYVEDVSGLEDALGGSRRGWKLWDLVLIVVLLIGLFEPWLANQISARLYAKPKEPPALRVSVPGVGETVEPLAEGAAR
jgi:hypothetical protein